MPSGNESSPAPRQQGVLLYFAFGTDMRPTVFGQQCPGADWLGAARLADHRFAISTPGVATVKAEAGATVWGALWMVPATALSSLDELAGVAAGRSVRTTLRIVSPAGPRIEAMLYVASDDSTARASSDYLAAVLAGARENRLPAAYLKELSTWAEAKAG